RAYVVRRIAVAVETPAHADRLGLRDDLHLIDPPVTAHAAYAAREVHLVIEVDVVGKVVDADPRHRIAALPAVVDRAQARRVRLHDVVAAHARLRVGHHRLEAALDVRVAIAAVEAELSGVLPVAEGHGLHRRVADL